MKFRSGKSIPYWYSDGRELVLLCWFWYNNYKRVLFFIKTTADINFCTSSGDMKSGKIWFIIKGAYSSDMSLAHVQTSNKEIIVWIVIEAY